jgi:hypothetical protein
MYNSPWNRPRGKTYEERRIEKFHKTLQPSVREEIEKYKFQIEFIEPTWVIKEYSGGFIGRVNHREMSQIGGGIPFGVLSVSRDKKKQCSYIWVWSDGMCDGENCHLINVPNGLFKEIH